jgi:hypothetical protein
LNEPQVLVKEPMENDMFNPLVWFRARCNNSPNSLSYMSEGHEIDGGSPGTAHLWLGAAAETETKGIEN